MSSFEWFFINEYSIQLENNQTFYGLRQETVGKNVLYKRQYVYFNKIVSITTNVENTAVHL